MEPSISRGIIFVRKPKNASFGSEESLRYFNNNMSSDPEI